MMLACCLPSLRETVVGPMWCKPFQRLVAACPSTQPFRFSTRVSDLMQCRALLGTCLEGDGMVFWFIVASHSFSGFFIRNAGINVFSFRFCVLLVFITECFRSFNSYGALLAITQF